MRHTTRTPQGKARPRKNALASVKEKGPRQTHTSEAKPSTSASQARVQHECKPSEGKHKTVYLFQLVPFLLLAAHRQAQLAVRAHGADRQARLLGGKHVHLVEHHQTCRQRQQQHSNNNDTHASQADRLGWARRRRQAVEHQGQPFSSTRS
jgi:hypothetical protein